MSDPDDHRAPSRIRDVYDEIADHFAQTRAYPWPEVSDFLADKSGTRALDIGCGNGRHSELLAERVDSVIGLDVSAGLLRTARTRMAANDWQAHLLQADAATLPLGAGTVDIGIYVATLHHLPDRETRRESLNELARVLGPDGQALVSAWSTAHDRFDANPDAREGFDTTIDWTLPGGETVPRFYHIYAPAEFETDLAASDLFVRDSYLSSGNCYAEVEGKRP
jgi:tRNA (uracil-5-)-methyltransferase TRM9